MPNIGNYAGSILSDAYGRAAQYKLEEGRAYGRAAENIGAHLKAALDLNLRERQEKERNKQASAALSDLLGVDEKITGPIVKTMGPEMVFQYKRLKNAEEKTAMELDLMRKQEEEQIRMGQFLKQAAGMDGAGKNIRMLNDMATNGITVTANQLNEALQMDRQAGFVPRSTDLTTGERMIETEPGKWREPVKKEQPYVPMKGTLPDGTEYFMNSKSSSHIVDPKELKKTGVSLDDVVNVKIPQTIEGINGQRFLDYENAPTVRMTVADAVKNNIPGYDIYRPEYEARESGGIAKNENQDFEEAKRVAKQFESGTITKEEYTKKIREILKTPESYGRFESWYMRNQ